MIDITNCTKISRKKTAELLYKGRFWECETRPKHEDGFRPTGGRKVLKANSSRIVFEVMGPHKQTVIVSYLTFQKGDLQYLMPCGSILIYSSHVDLRYNYVEPADSNPID